MITIRRIIDILACQANRLYEQIKCGIGSRVSGVKRCRYRQKYKLSPVSSYWPQRASGNAARPARSGRPRPRLADCRWQTITHHRMSMQCPGWRKKSRLAHVTSSLPSDNQAHPRTIDTTTPTSSRTITSRLLSRYFISVERVQHIIILNTDPHSICTP